MSELPRNLFSGFVVSLIALPLGLGLALASGAPPISGVVAAIVGGIMVSLLGGSHVTIAGPGNGLVVVVLSSVIALGEGDLTQGFLYTLAAIVVSGVLLFAMGVFRLGRLADFFPASAIEGMLAAIGWIIFAKQFHVMIGNTGANGDVVPLLISIPHSLGALVTEAGPAQQFTAAVGLVSLLILIVYARLRSRIVQLIPAPMWILILSMGLFYAFGYLGRPYPLTREFLIDIPTNLMESLPSPDFSKGYTLPFLQSVVSITLIASIESLLSIKAVDKLDPLQRRSNVNRDLRALGLATIVSGLLGGLNVVIVIARSSVNVNSQASNRSANFLHAGFLLAFVLLLQAQLSTIPLSALAAILVYTGFKLGTPQTLFRVAQIGREQVAIFLATLLTTLFANLITGILAGILMTLVLHIFITRNPFLFLQNVFKPNVLVFKESDEGTYYVSVKHFCNFMNFYKLREKLDAIPEHEQAVIDFSMCQFVDHTVMEGIDFYTESFFKKGGDLSVIGLDGHGADSRHPQAIRNVIPFRGLQPIEDYFTGRQKRLRDFALEYQWDYRPARSQEAGFLMDFVFFRTRQINYIYNTLHGENGALMISDIEFSEGEFIAKENIRSTFMQIDLPGSLPVFTLDKEGIWQRLYSQAGFKEILLSGHPDFNRRFFLSGEDAPAIERLFSDDLIRFLESNPLYHIESNGPSLLILKKERPLSVPEIKAMVFFGRMLKQTLMDSVGNQNE